MVYRNTLRVIALTTAAALAASMLSGMARAQDVPATDLWFIQGAISVPGESAPRLTKFVVPGEDNRPFVLVFNSKDECEATRHDDPEVAGPLALFQISVTKRGATVEITCEKFVHPKVEPPGQPV